MAEASLNPLIVIPTFVSSRTGKQGSSPTTVYDHVTLLSEEGELGRCLESLSKLGGVGRIAVLVVADHATEAKAYDKVLRTCARFPRLDTLVVGAAQAALVRQRLDRLGVCALDSEIGLAGYGAMRNLGLILAAALGYNGVLFLDDDVVIEDPDFMEKAVYGLGKLTKRGIPILAKTGYYLNAEGTYHSMSQDKWYNRYWQQGKAFNQWIDAAMAAPRLSRGNHVCGGCLILHREAFRRLSFDPWITRGEDLDYLLDLRMYGADIWFDNQWWLHHLPPATHSEGLRFRQDIYRWLYEYRKMEYSRSQIDLHPIKPASLKPYPGPFLEEGIDKRIRRTARLRSFGRPDKAAYRKAARAAANEAAIYAERNCSKYFEFQYVWPQLVARIEGDKLLCREFGAAPGAEEMWARAAAGGDGHAGAAAPASGQARAAEGPAAAGSAPDSPAASAPAPARASAFAADDSDFAFVD